MQVQAPPSTGDLRPAIAAATAVVADVAVGGGAGRLMSTAAEAEAIGTSIRKGC